MVAERLRLGDREAGTIVGQGHQQALVSLTERKSKLTLLAKVEHAAAEIMRAAVIQLLSSVGVPVEAITADNGREFAQHEKMAAELQMDYHCVHPYHSWERGLNENANGLGRQYSPKTATSAAALRRRCKRGWTSSATGRVRPWTSAPCIKYLVVQTPLHLRLETANTEDVSKWVMPSAEPISRARPDASKNSP